MSARDHHPSDDTLLAYSSAALDQNMAVIVATHMALCPPCRDKAAQFDDVGGALLENVEAAPLAAGGLESVLRRAQEPVPAAARVVAGGDASIPRPLRDYLPGPIANLPWRFLAPGTRQFVLNAGSADGGSLRLLRIVPGAVLLRHGHKGSELTVVLRGSFTDERGRFRPGDCAEVDESVDHRPRADKDAICICAIATDAPLVLHGVISKLMRPWTGF